MLAAALDGVQVRFGVPVIRERTSESGPTLDLADGFADGADVVVGADGIHSAVRTSRFGPEPTRFSGWAQAYRALVPRHRGIPPAARGHDPNGIGSAPCELFRRS